MAHKSHSGNPCTTTGGGGDPHTSLLLVEFKNTFTFLLIFHVLIGIEPLLYHFAGDSVLPFSVVRDNL